MKKLLLGLLIGAMIYLTYNTIAQGKSLFGYDIPSYKSLNEENAKLDTNIANLNKKITSEYSFKVGEVAKEKTAFNAQKQEYDSLAANATDEQLEAAMREEEFLLDYLWILIGNYADDNNVKILMDVNADFTIDFDVTGSYISIVNFLYDLSNDPELRFAIENIQLEGGSNTNTVTKAKFTIYGINVVTKIEE